MIRNTRKQTGIKFTDRIVKTLSINATGPEYKLYDDLNEFIRGGYYEAVKFTTEEYREVDFKYLNLTALKKTETPKRTLKGNIKLILMLLQRELVSSNFALIGTLNNLLKSPLYNHENIRRLITEAYQIAKPSKFDRVLDLLDNAQDEKVIIYTGFRATMEQLFDMLEIHGYDCIKFYGGLSSKEKDLAIYRFKEKSQVMICTDSGSEGLNLQFCNILVNYDLPWNPMRIEQRIGRVHRLKQTRDVYIFNLSIKNTIEDYIITRLFEKINLFKRVIGEIGLILTAIEHDDMTVESAIFSCLINAKNKREIITNLDKLAIKIKDDIEAIEKARQLNQQIFDRLHLDTMSVGIND